MIGSLREEEMKLEVSSLWFRSNTSWICEENTTLLCVFWAPRENTVQKYSWAAAEHTCAISQELGNTKM